MKTNLLIFSSCLTSMLKAEETVIDESILYGVCYQNSNVSNSNPPQIIPSTENQAIIFTDYGFSASSDNPIKCLWFDSNRCAECASERDIQTIERMLNASTHLMECEDRITSISQQRHFCSDLCTA